MANRRGPYPAHPCPDCGRERTVSTQSHARQSRELPCLACTRKRNGWQHAPACTTPDDWDHRGPCPTPPTTGD